MYLFSFYCSPTFREEAISLIKLYFNQITKGCGQEDCDNEQCASSKRFKHDHISNDEAAAKAVTLFQNNSKLCVSNGENGHRVVKPIVVEAQEDIEYSIPVQETGRGRTKQAGALYRKSGAKITINAKQSCKGKHSVAIISPQLNYLYYHLI